MGLTSPLSQKQKTVWSLINRRLSSAEIAEKFGVTRQFVNQTKLAAEAKLMATLLDVAQANDLRVLKLYSKEAILLGYHPGLGRKAIVTYTTTFGVKIWYWYDRPDEVVNDEEFLKRTRMYLLDFAKERGIAVQNPDDMHPAELANVLFSKLIPELKL